MGFIFFGNFVFHFCALFCFWAGRALSRVCLKLRLDLPTSPGLARVVESVFEIEIRPDPAGSGYAESVSD